MTAIHAARLSSHSSEASMDSEHSSAGFTAVNGKESPRIRVNGSHLSKRTSSDMSESEHNEDSDASRSYSQANGHIDPATKRKRSLSQDRNGGSPSRYDCSPPKRLEQTQQVADRALNVLVNSEREAASPYTESLNGVGHRPDAGQWSQREAPPKEGYNVRPDSSELRLAEVLQQATHDPSQRPPREWAAAHRPLTNGEERRTYPPDQPVQTSSSGKRKRMFSNRTKTGCLTCRRRKKKCDETHPTCTNCQRGGFECMGYNTTRETWKISEPKQHLAVHGKDGSRDAPSAVYKHSVSPPDARHRTFSREGAQMRPIAIDDNDIPTANFTSSPQSTEPRSRGSYSGHNWPQHGHPPYNNDHLPPFSEVARPEPPKPDYVNVSSIRDMSRPTGTAPHPPPAPNPQTGQWQGHPPPEYRPNYPPPRIDTTQNQPPRSSVTGYQSAPKTFTQGDVERSKMLRGAPYNHYDQTLENERQRCEEACKRYNNACSLLSGVTKEGAEDMLRKILDPSLDTSHRPIAPHAKKGLLGPGVRVEGPFNCTYGYNIHLFDNVCIGKGCEIDDAANVNIGARTWIGPNVTIFTSEISRDLIDRKGTESRTLAKAVSIGDEVIIGRNALIFPGVNIPRGCVIEPGAVVKTSLGENQIALVCPGQRGQA